MQQGFAVLVQENPHIAHLKRLALINDLCEQIPGHVSSFSFHLLVGTHHAFSVTYIRGLDMKEPGYISTLKNILKLFPLVVDKSFKGHMRFSSKGSILTAG